MFGDTSLEVSFGSFDHRKESVSQFCTMPIQSQRKEQKSLFSLTSSSEVHHITVTECAMIASICTRLVYKAVLK